MSGNYMEIANSSWMFLFCGLAVGYVFVQSFVFMGIAWQHGKEIGLEKSVMTKAMVNSALVSVVPSLPILLWMLTLLPTLGNYFPWLRLSVIGSGTYESTAANMTVTALGLEGLTDPNLSPSNYIVILMTMTVGIVWGLLILLFGAKSIDVQLAKVQGKNKLLFDKVVSGIFIAMLCIFTGPYFANYQKTVKDAAGVVTIILNKPGIVSMCVMVISAVAMLFLEYISKKFKLLFLSDFGLPLCMLFGMLAAKILTSMIV